MRLRKFIFLKEIILRSVRLQRCQNVASVWFLLLLLYVLFFLLLIFDLFFFSSQCFRLIRLIDHLILQFLLPHWNRYSLLIKRKHIFVHWGRNYTLFYRHFYFGDSYKGRYAHLVILSFLHYSLLEQLSSNSSTNMFWYVTSMFWIA